MRRHYMSCEMPLVQSASNRPSPARLESIVGRNTKGTMMNSFNKMHVCGLVIVLSLAMLACGTVQAGVVNVATYSSANELAFDSQISATDLINIGQPSFVSSANTVAPGNSPISLHH